MATETTALGSGDPAVSELINSPERFLNRELSWLAFNRRVLGEAGDRRHPLLERVKFLAIFSSNLDEFFMVRVSGILEQVKAKAMAVSPDGLTPEQQLARIKPVVVELGEEQHRRWLEDLRPELDAAGIRVCDYADLDDEQQASAERIFREDIFPVLTPLAFDPGRPFPFISNLSLNLAVVVRDEGGEERFARIKLPVGTLPRLVRLPGDEHETTLVWIEQLIAAHLHTLFPGYEIVASYPFKVTRDADVDYLEEEASDLRASIVEGIRERQFGDVVRLTVDASMPASIRDILLHNLEIDASALYQVVGPLGLGALMEVTRLDRPDLKAAPLVPALPARLPGSDIFSTIRERDLLLHHPFDSFDPVVELVRAAAEDPQVLAIKQTLYRVGRDAPVVAALVRAREQGKQVTVLVEIKARFDEENNIEWSRQLEDVGVHVVYGLVGLKTHCKVALVVRKEPEGIRCYLHLGTGNYNATTARLYTDLGVLTCDGEAGADASELFNYLTGYSKKEEYRRFLVAPVNIRPRLNQLIEREIEHQRAGRGGQLVLKMNSLTDQAMIDALYQASIAGVQIDLIVRGVCCLRPGMPGLSETIRVRSIIGHFLEHSRVYYFGNGGNAEIYLGSADLMSRNLDRRVEVLFPVRDAGLRDRLRHEILENYLRDTANAHLLQPDGSYTRPPDDEEFLDSHLVFADGQSR